MLQQRRVINVANCGVIRQVCKPVEEPSKWGFFKTLWDMLLRIIAVACFLIGACLAFGV
ncbi:hypothetical protein [Pelosinus sp. UFO1]|uniref:hypothetical protein n=1 Tax=Pelosinus sp. UFO1 TaxID=484770 RepID=UPI0004D10A4A|nr:hypothetical protein [Pelosinus sp. UFO1]AIF51223.1 hypothetical protein UFO1_1672 [Pelosinus sp. UFO1]